MLNFKLTQLTNFDPGLGGQFHAYSLQPTPAGKLTGTRNPVSLHVHVPADNEIERH